MNLIDTLPSDSALNRVRDPDGAGMSRWSSDTWLLAQLSEQVDLLTRITYGAAVGRKAQRIKPLRIPRPELPLSEQPKPKKRRAANTAETLAILRGEI